MERFEYVVVIEAETEDQADIVIRERVGYDEDLSEYGVGDYTIAVDNDRIPVRRFWGDRS